MYYEAIWGNSGKYTFFLLSPCSGTVLSKASRSFRLGSGTHSAEHFRLVESSKYIISPAMFRGLHLQAPFVFSLCFKMGSQKRAWCYSEVQALVMIILQKKWTGINFLISSTLVLFIILATYYSHRLDIQCGLECSKMYVLIILVFFYFYTEPYLCLSGRLRRIWPASEVEACLPLFAGVPNCVSVSRASFPPPPL